MIKNLIYTIAFIVIFISNNTIANEIAPSSKYKYNQVIYNSIQQGEDAMIVYRESQGGEHVKLVQKTPVKSSGTTAYPYTVYWFSTYTANGGLGVYYTPDISQVLTEIENKKSHPRCHLERELQVIESREPEYYKIRLTDLMLAGDSAYCHLNTNTYTRVGDYEITLRYNYQNVALYQIGYEDNQLPQTCEGSFGNPCSIFTGNKYQVENDYSSKYLNFTRYYNSEQKYTLSELGNGWSFSFSDRIRIPNGANYTGGLPQYVEYINEKGHVIGLQNKGNGEYRASNELNMNLIKVGTQIILNDNGIIKYFDVSNGLLKKIKYESYEITIERNGNQISKISNNFGDEIIFNYTGNILSSITLPSLNQITFSQDINSNLNQVVYPDGKSKQYHYEDPNFLGLLTGITDENNIRYATWSYDVNGKGISSEHYNGFEKTTINSSRTIVSNSKNLETTYARNYSGYNGSGWRIPKVASVSTNGDVKSNSYNSYNLGFKNQVVYPNNLKIKNIAEDYNYERVKTVEYYDNSTNLLDKSITYDFESYYITSDSINLGKKTSKITHDLYSIEFTFDDSMRTTSKTITDLTDHTIPYATNGRTRTVSYAHGANGLVKAIEGARTDVNDFTFIDYDDFGNVTQIKNALCHDLNSIDEYDSTLVENANCQKIQFGNYNADHQPQLMIDVNGVQTTMSYDLRNRLKTSTVHYSTGALTTTYDYDGVGQLDKVTLPDGSWLDYDFNGARYLVKVTNSIGETIEFDHDTEGMVTQRTIKSASGTITNQFNQVWTIDNKLEKFISGEGFETTYSYDVMDEVDSITDHLGNIVSFERDLYSQITKEIDPLLGEVTRTYDQSGNVTSVTDQRGNTTTYTVDGFGETIRLVSPDTGTENYWRDEAGNITKKSNANTVVEYSFDVLNRLIFIDYLDDALDTTFAYDVGANAKGKMTSVLYKHGSISFTYDGFGQVEDKVSLINGVFNTTSYNRDMYGRLDSMVYPSGMILNYTYDGLGRLDKITMQVTSGATEITIVENIDYLPFGGIKSYDYGNGTSFSADFNLDYLVTNVTHNNGLLDLFSENYTYRKLHQIDSITDNVNVLNNQAFTFDAKDQLVGANGVYGDYDYTYDTVGNRLSKTVDLTIVEDYTIDATSNRLNNVLKGLESRTFGFDSVGNVTSDNDFDGTTTILDYADNNRLVKATVGGVEFDYGYNPFGQRILDNGKTNQFDQVGNLIHVQDSSSTVEYIYIGSTKVAMIKDGVVYYAHNNYMGLPRLYTDSSMNVVWSGEFKPFGELFNENGQVSNWVRFIGQWENVETDYFYNYFRDYDPTLGRYLQSDPIGLNAGVNTYAYVLNNPINKVDPFGLSENDINSLTNNLEVSYKELIDKGYKVTGGIKSFGVLNDYLVGFSNNNCRYLGKGDGIPLMNLCPIGITKQQASKIKQCSEQTVYVQGNLKEILPNLDDTWNIYTVKHTGHYNGILLSDNPSDPLIEYDPWLNKINIVNDKDKINSVREEVLNLKLNNSKFIDRSTSLF